MVNNLVLKWTILKEKLHRKETIPLVHEIDIPSVTPPCPFRMWQDMSLSTSYKKNRPHVVTQTKITLKLPQKLGYPKKGQTAMSISDAQQKSVVLASPSQSGNSERWAIKNTPYRTLSHAIILNAGKGPPTLQSTVIPPWNYAPQLPGKVTPTSSPIVNATLKWKSTKKLSSLWTVGLPTMGPMG